MGALNKWECNAQGCKATAVGIGSAIGLWAIGWWFEAGKSLFCPAHRPDPTMKRNPSVPCDQAGPCGWCRAEEEADKIQYVIGQYLELTGEDLAYYRKRTDKWAEARTEL